MSKKCGHRKHERKHCNCRCVPSNQLSLGVAGESVFDINPLLRVRIFSRAVSRYTTVGSLVGVGNGRLNSSVMYPTVQDLVV